MWYSSGITRLAIDWFSTYVLKFIIRFVANWARTPFLDYQLRSEVSSYFQRRGDQSGGVWGVYHRLLLLSSCFLYTGSSLPHRVFSTRSTRGSFGTFLIFLGNQGTLEPPASHLSPHQSTMLIWLSMCLCLAPYCTSPTSGIGWDKGRHEEDYLSDEVQDRLMPV